MISQETIEQIKQRARLVEIVQEQVELQRRGANWVGRCPFHAENTPSFTVRDGDNFFHCFGCGASGNIFSYVMEMQGLSFPEAVEQLAARYNIEVKRVGGKKEQERGPDKRLLYQANQQACSFFCSQLESAGPAVQAYLKERGLTKESIEAFQLGFAPGGGRTLCDKLKTQKFSEEMLFTAGLVRRGEGGDCYDMFRDRLVFPVLIDAKRVAGFGGRAIPALLSEEQKQRTPKYLNSRETPIYEKKKVLYGLSQAVAAIRSKGEVLLVEGYMDVVGLWQVGVRNVVATCGTAVTAEHIRRLASLAKQVLILFDADRAGREAASPCFELFLNCGVDVGAVFLPEGSDPDSIAQKHKAGSEEYLRSLERKGLLDCRVLSLLEKFGGGDLQSLGAAAKANLAKELCVSLARVKSDIERNELTRRASFLLMVNYGQLQHMVEAERGGEIHTLQLKDEDEQKEKPAQHQEIVSVGELPKVDQDILLAVMAGKERMLRDVLDDSVLVLGIHPTTRMFFEGFLQVLEDGERQSVEAQKDKIKMLLDVFGSSWLRHWRKSYAMVREGSSDMQTLFRNCCQELRLQGLRHALAQIDREVLACGDEEACSALYQEKLLLSRKIQGLMAKRQG